jgi:hypothetical protein
VKVLKELPTGARLATETCLSCWKENKFPTVEFVSFLRSIATHSTILNRLFSSGAEGVIKTEDGSTGCEEEGECEIKWTPFDGEFDEEMFDIENTDIYADAQTDQAQHERRMEEIMRRRLEKADGSDKMQKMRNFIRRTLTVFSQELPLSARAHFVQTIRQYLNAGPSAIEQLAQTILQLVDEHGALLSLHCADPNHSMQLLR